MKCYFDSASNYLYSSFYLDGLYRVLGRKNVSINHSKFSSLPDPGYNARFIIVKNGIETRFVIQTIDTYIINENMYEWCDVYGCVNANFKHYPQEQYSKLISLAPSFGVCVYNNFQTICYALKTMCLSFNIIAQRVEWNPYKNCEEVNFCWNIRHHFGRIINTKHTRISYDEYLNPLTIGENNYVFFQSTLWTNNKDNNNDAEVNMRRANFIRAIKKQNNIHFEGGLLANKSSSKGIFDDVVTHRHVPMNEWIEKIKKSTIVFNTPAFWNCHGWKLGEYLALGKCIISTKLFNDLPSPLIHGEHIHFVDDTIESMEFAIKYIVEHPEYRLHLENGAREWWNKYGTPERSLELLGIH